MKNKEGKSTLELMRDVTRFENLEEKLVVGLGYELIVQINPVVCFMKSYRNYTVVVRTTFNPKLGKRGEFTSKDGCGRVSVFNNIGERVYTRRFHKFIMDHFVENLFLEAAFLENRLYQRPRVPGTSSFYEIKQTKSKVIWIAPLETKNPEDKIKEFYLGKIPANLKNHFFIFKNRTWYYRTVVCSEKKKKALRKKK
ncbi:MAG: hypothetical protein WAV23_04065 [Minisyncoccia bacterium]